MEQYPVCAFLLVSVLASSPSPPPVDDHQEQLELEYIEYYGNDIRIQREWTTLRVLWFAKNLKEMKTFCKTFHEAAGKGTLDTEKLIVLLNINVLRYKGTHSRDFARIDVVKYVKNETYASGEQVLLDEEEGLEEPQHYFITGGRGPNCVYYLEPTDQTCMEFYLEQHVCKKEKAHRKSNSTSRKTNE